jgi:hypothetical protein
MTIDERFERIEHYTAGLAEERRKDREEYKALWRDTQQKIDKLGALTLQFAEESRAEDRRLKALIEQFAQESRAADERLGARIEEADQRLIEADQRLQARIESLVSGFGEFIAKMAQQPRLESRL